ncbi:hypothetical protein CcCBS67573_g05535 [Chytriomyces confervae]|uniref:FAD-binding domain-containing protein n=1 Tax=Chytriomyces confervae TaxID=246404 RepID=A0A507FAM0_9FUNG|nr:hypothetical protein HDU80_005159 [Chytriomyces hyalinus]TPX73192.1 hypothetical protein CcCBS67573_g05535 [Chytriomyces confervae]
MEVIISGSGLVGAAMALSLHKAGIKSTLYDQIDLLEAAKAAAMTGAPVAVEFGDSGGSVMLGASALRVIKKLGLLDELLANSSPSKFTHWFKIDGTAQVVLDAVHSNSKGEPDPALHAPIQIMRSKLHSILINACSKAGIRTYMGKKLVSVDDSGFRVTAHFADGSSATGDLLIGADGIHSATRIKAFDEKLKAEFTGVLGYIGVVDLEAHNIKLHETCAFYIERNKKQLVATFKVTEKIAAINVMTFADPDPEESKEDAYRPYSDLPKHSARLADLIAGWGVPKNVEAMMRHAYRISPASIYDLPDLKTYHKGKVVLVGDAAHGMVPNAGLGLVSGLEDVGTLLELFLRFPEVKDIHKVLRIYSKLRVPQATDAAARSRAMSKQYYSSSVFGQSFSHFVLRLGIFAFNHDMVKYYDIFDCPTQVAAAVAAEGDAQ